MEQDNNNPRVYVGTYHKYAGGSIDGEWVDLTDFSNYDEFMDYIRELHSDEDDPEFMYQDFENFPRVWYSECGLDEKTFDKIIEYAEHDNQDALDAYMMCYNREDIEGFDNAYMGEWDSEEDFAEHIIDECYPDIPDFALRYFDYSAFARDLFMDGYSYYNGYVFCDR